MANAQVFILNDIYSFGHLGNGAKGKGAKGARV